MSQVNIKTSPIWAEFQKKSGSFKSVVTRFVPNGWKTGKGKFCPWMTYDIIVKLLLQ